jgi:hypothetical protein
MRAVVKAFLFDEKPPSRSWRASWIVRCAFVLSVASGAFGQATTTTLVGTLADPFGNSAAKLTATCSFRAGAIFNAASGWTVLGGSTTRAAEHSVAVTQGAFSVALVPTDTANPPSPSAYYEMRCRVPWQTADGRNCEGSSALQQQGVCVVAPGDIGPLYVDVPTSGTAVNLKDHYRTARPQGLTWGQLLLSNTTWGQLLSGR